MKALDDKYRSNKKGGLYNEDGDEISKDDLYESGEGDLYEDMETLPQHLARRRTASRRSHSGGLDKVILLFNVVFVLLKKLYRHIHM